jgi:hypothetical protein
VFYCDAVLTDKAARNALAASAEIKPLKTFLPRRPHELADWISNLPKPTEPRRDHDHAWHVPELSVDVAQLQIYGAMARAL